MNLSSCRSWLAMEKMGCQRSNSSRKPTRRRSHTRKRKAQCSSVINMAEARREIAHALHLHRSSSTFTNTPAAAICSSVINSAAKMPALAATTSYCCNSLVEAMSPLIPFTEPLWSTTAPSVPPPPLLPFEAMESCVEWAENPASSSYSWWLAFLQALDDGNKTKHPSADNVDLKVNPSVLEQQQSEPTNFAGATDSNASLDEWMMFPATTQDDI